MFYMLKKLSAAFWALSVASIILSIISGYILLVTHIRDAGILLTYFWLCLLFVPASLIGVAVTLRKVADELNDESFHLRERLKKLENK